MLTPRFSLSQDTTTVTIIIRAPYCNLQELETNVDDNEFMFICKPYYLRLNLPGALQENERTKSSFNADAGEFTFQYEKLHPGEDFPNLELVTRFLCTKVEVDDGSRKIEIISCNENDGNLQDTPVDQCQYGFAMRGGYNFKVLHSEFNDIFEVDPYSVVLQERRKLRIAKENRDFNLDHYLADLIDNLEINELLQLETPWSKLSMDKISFTPQELDFLKDLTNVEYKLSTLQIKYCHNCLLDILYAYCYDRRSTCFETTCESGWTISKLSASLCWFDGFQQPKEALVCAYRRSLIYPLFREFRISQKVFDDLKLLLELGDQFMIKCLIDIYHILVKGDSGRYVFNNLFIKDYIIYIMKWDKELWNETVNETKCVIINKKDLGLNLLEIEENTVDLSKTMANLNVSDTDSDDSTETDGSSYESTDSSHS